MRIFSLKTTATGTNATTDVVHGIRHPFVHVVEVIVAYVVHYLADEKLQDLGVLAAADVPELAEGNYPDALTAGVGVGVGVGIQVRV